ncbi:hypothetical protein ACOMICROBIO_FLGHMIGD_01616 [Vibrio sp. B1FLJ16]|uniref:hypothetical protein n=1 Tax=Vibrio sp. B1FLJ16 TaxID=2751178 RepID=UPI0015F6C94A|nr:hypothetical protein [Vibrio sp. B1FLJ16]CAD7807056.1 hypothetical protein ACOMICROBIO_FLGHMIGD_01616 [Vibrio sp. B1FLJ16]CAE6903655.1 hypothetical protein ACOMICROBIO_FLGHMIGD_01616 [Vibrio sp. B1FLJ16]
MKVIDKINKIALDNYFKRVNFKYHLLPLVREAVDSYSESIQDYGAVGVDLEVLSENWKTYYEAQENEIWSDSIFLSLGHLPVFGIRAVVPVKGRTRVLSEQQARLVFSQTISGDVFAILYPPKSEVMAMKKDGYIIDRWGNPLDISLKQVVKLLKLTLLINAYCKAVLFPNRKALKLMAQVEAKDSVMSNGGSRLWVLIMYLVKSVKGVARLYGVGTPK